VERARAAGDERQPVTPPDTIVKDPASWSKSKMAALRECRRKLRFIGIKSKDDPAAALKNLKNRHLWTGTVVHEAVGEMLKTVRQGAPLPTEEEVILHVKTRMRDQFKNSKDANGDGSRLFEHAYQLPIAPPVWQGHWATVEKSLRWFLSSTWLKRLKTLGPECWKTVDEVLGFDVNGIKAYVKIDCAVETGGRFVLIDWKTSSLKEKDLDSLQVAALYAHEVWGADVEQIDGMAVSLLDGRSLKAAIDEETLMETHLRIEEEAGLLSQELDIAVADPLTLPAASMATCLRCNFQKVCYPSGI
jgi:hypothetical protein